MNGTSLWTIALPAIIAALSALAGVGFSTRQANRRDKEQLTQQRQLITLQSRRDSYVELLRAAKRMTKHERQVATYLSLRPITADPGEAERTIANEGAPLAAQLEDAFAATLLNGSSSAKAAARNLRDAHLKAEPVLQAIYVERRYDPEALHAVIEGAEAAEEAFLFVCRHDLDVDLLDEGRDPVELPSASQRKAI